MQKLEDLSLIRGPRSLRCFKPTSIRKVSTEGIVTYGGFSEQDRQD